MNHNHKENKNTYSQAVLSILSLAILLSVFMLSSCGDDTSGMGENEDLSLVDVITTVSNKPAKGESLGNVGVLTTGLTNLVYEITSQSNEGAILINSTSGALTVGDETLFEFNLNPVITAEVLVTAEGLSGTAMVTINVDEITDAQMSIIDYFQEIAHKSSQGLNSNTTRWEQNMKLFVVGNSDQAISNELIKITGEINDLITTNTKVEIVNNMEDSNAEIFFGSPQGFVDHYITTVVANGIQLQTLEDSFGNATIGGFREDGIQFAYIFVDTENTSETERNHLMREYLTRALGLRGLSKTFEESIFFDNTLSENDNYADIDKDLIRLLYHPGMNQDVSETATSLLLKRILASEN